MMTSETDALVLLQRVAKHGDASLQCREVSLRLSADQQHLILSRYSEHYSPEGLEWVERQHFISVTELIRWVIKQGEPQVLVRGADSGLGAADTIQDALQGEA
ncbi:hypothetical protein ACVNP3_24730 [Pseudomonas chlororaphis subsp. piscium]|uniref:hypothetical protein n=1 Tax=Pseudomonas TaxID=286 RepID=UPI0004714095|nr:MULTISPECIES: hypothetical protein [Pseudomonas]AZC53021.1 hypothetical protein C4K35_5462 [Pseudomonas chlororaphis subsp. piscium]AZC59277.1 hypothetical protein C4K34_5136 [Pseudomonas chlororaphis subsp. piscium]AZC71729.1 hypothetical protein C4K32_5091 [Pseudomonas chlororaphis subsp. piscium]AZC77979.1 hypothetical protein C4K31_5100 [Pseudomonas chlororaphis subsp. piscium]AZC91598.1 hypothetical protein C4K29_5321 [Pseudomonas chlororaphis subsp. piscium]